MATPHHPDQLSGNYESRELFPRFIRIRRDEARGLRAMDVARNQARRFGELPIWAVDVPNPKSDPKLVGIKYFFVASYTCFRDYYRDLNPAERRVYEIARVIPTRFYLDLDVDIAENPDLPLSTFFEKRNTLVGAVYAELALLSGVDASELTNTAGTMGEFVVMDSTRPSKISQHLIFPNAVLRNPFHCGALLRRVRERLMRQHEAVLDEGDSKRNHPFFIWTRVRDRSNPGETLMERLFFADLKVYTFDRNFRVLGSRKNIPGAMPLLEEGNADGCLSWDILDKTILQRISRDTCVLDCMELDGSMPVSTNNDNFLRYDAKTPLPVPSTAGAGAAAAHVTRAPVAVEHMRDFWETVYPFDILWRLTSGDGQREFRFVDARGTWTRSRVFEDVSSLRSAVLDALPAQIHVGPMHTGETVNNPALAFDVDITDYAIFRPCCGDSGTACPTCWPVLIFAQKAIAAYLQEIGMSVPFFFFSGSKGVHAWLPPSDTQARRVACSEGGRAALLADFASFYRPPDNTPAPDAEPVKGSLPGYRAAVDTRACVATAIGSDEAYWGAFVRDTMRFGGAFDRHAHSHGVTSAIVHALWPRLDEAVTRDPQHKIKAPFCMHPRTNRCAVWLPTPQTNPYADDAAKPLNVIAQLRARLA